MNPEKVTRSRLEKLTDLPNVGPATAADLRMLGITEPGQLKGRSPYDLYEELCGKTGVRHDPCVLDVFISITRFMDGGEPRPWWHYTDERKKCLGSGPDRDG
ncbi:helix-hairpin-helix domain-containing protein [Desulfomicrobium orale]|uniref:Mitomycin resistance protein n=1 Tax=Desulfomicrobium orale DSM 12838 TaxID=888061 RepID=A0A0X8JND5_9BACT|nr:helix-hairpin-helix domain-containing protein [Desulfomicrobium orale]AMD91782.1 mitomycin resistance protein [Desulfomicrobium orale DSM 12838]